MEVVSRHLVAFQLQTPSDFARGNLTAPPGRTSGHVFCRMLCSKLRGETVGCAVHWGQALQQGHVLHATREERGVSCVIPGVLQEARQGHDAGLAVRLLWSYAERIFPLTAIWSFIQKTGEQIHLFMQCKNGGSRREKGPTRDGGCI